jgi:riboflavin kinase / FMN adenylyltransferase
MKMTVTSQPSELRTGPRAVALGCFDGVHVGHRALVASARRAGLRTTVVTFDPHPRHLLGAGVQLISSVRRRSELLTSAGADDVLVTAFSRAVAAMAPGEWINTVLTPIDTRQVFVGEGFRFGYRRSGDADTLREHGIEVVVHALEAGASSTRVRGLIGAGQLAEAESLLARPVEIEGLVSAVVRPASYLMRPAEGTVCPPPGHYRGRTASGPADVVVGPARQVLVCALAAEIVRPGDRCSVQLPSSEPVVDPADAVDPRRFLPGSHEQRRM